MIQRYANRFLVGAGPVLGMAVVAILVAAQLPAQDQVPGQDRPGPAVKIGIYNAEEAFLAHPAQKEMMDALTTAQTEMQQAQQEDDTQKIQQIQQQYEQARQQAVEQFQQDVSEALPEAAKAANVRVVATQVEYKADEVETTDITARLVKAFEEEAGGDGGEREEPAEPQFPGQ